MGVAVKMSDKLTRVAIVDSEKCKPSRCRQECKRSCPVVMQGKLCIEVTSKSPISIISEILCVGCGICVKKCPFSAISIINLPKNLEKDTTHRYGPNSFKLHRLPTPRAGQVLGLVGKNGIGKSTALKVLAGKLKPNLGRHEDSPDWAEILTYFRGSELQNYFTKILEDDLKAIIKPQYVDQIPRKARGTVRKWLDAKNEKDNKESICVDLALTTLQEHEVKVLSGGELQRFAIAMACIQQAEIYMFDEPSSYLDVKQRLQAARVIRDLLAPNVYVIAVEHDLSVLDYLSDFICVLYGLPGAYGVVTLPYTVREGINIFLDGFIPTENLRFRDVSLNFKVSETAELIEDADRQHALYDYPDMTRTVGGFKLTVRAGNFTDSEIIVMLGENGTGRELLHQKIRSAFVHPQFQTDVAKPLQIEDIIDQEVGFLSGGELQRVAICLCLGKPADVYLIDEPSAYLDSEQRIIAAKVIKRYILHAKKTAFVVEHDFIMATYLADRVVVYEGQPSVCTVANSPQDLLSGMNLFLRNLDITFRRDPNNFRPRINKEFSVKDIEQKKSGNYFFMD